jgi:hypothetical protein
MAFRVDKLLDRSDPAYRAALDLLQMLPASAEHTSAIDQRVSDPESPNSGMSTGAPARLKRYRRSKLRENSAKPWPIYEWHH